MSDIPEIVRFALPERVRKDIENAASKQKRVEEIRLHCGRRTTLTSAGRNIPTSAVLTRQEIDRISSRRFPSQILPIPFNCFIQSPGKIIVRIIAQQIPGLLNVGVGMFDVALPVRTKIRYNILA